MRFNSSSLLLRPSSCKFFDRWTKTPLLSQLDRCCLCLQQVEENLFVSATPENRHADSTKETPHVIGSSLVQCTEDVDSVLQSICRLIRSRKSLRVVVANERKTRNCRRKFGKISFWIETEDRFFLQEFLQETRQINLNVRTCPSFSFAEGQWFRWRRRRWWAEEKRRIKNQTETRQSVHETLAVDQCGEFDRLWKAKRFL